jgi:hypothetical protein
VHALGEGADEGLYMAGQLASLHEFLGEGAGLLHGGDLRGQQQPDERLRDGLAVASLAKVRRKKLLKLRDTVATESDTLWSQHRPQAPLSTTQSPRPLFPICIPHLVGIKKRGLIVHALDVSSTTNALVHGDLTEGLVAVLLLELLQGGLLGGNLSLQDVLNTL